MKLDDFIIIPKPTEREKNQYKHFVSESLVYAMNFFETGMISKEQLQNLVYSFRDNSVDEKQRKFFEAYLKLVDKVEETLNERVQQA